MSGIGKSIETERILVDARHWEWGLAANRYEVSLGVMKMYWNCIVVMVAQP